MIPALTQPAIQPNGYYLWNGSEWSLIDPIAAQDFLGINHCAFMPQDVSFFSVQNLDLQLENISKFCAFTINDQGERAYAKQESVIQHIYDNPHFRYLIKPGDFLDEERTILIEKALGNPKALEIRI